MPFIFDKVIVCVIIIPMKFIWSYMKKHIWAILLVLFVKFVGTALELLLPFILEHMIDDIAPLKNVKLILIWGFIMIALALLCRFLNVGANRGSVRIARKCIYQVRQDLFTKGINLSGDQFDEIGLPSLISRMTSDSYNIQSFMQITQTIAVRAPILLFGGIFITLSMDKGLAMVLITLAPILLIAVVIISRKGIPLYDKVQSHLDTVVRIMRENITGIRVVKALSKEDYEKRRFANANETMNRAEIKASVVMSLPGPVISLAMNVGLTLVVYTKMYKDETGTAHKFFEDGYCTLIPEGALGNTWYGTTPDERTLMGNPNYDTALVNTGIAVTVTTTSDPVHTKTTVSEIVLPSYERMDETFVIKAY